MIYVLTAIAVALGSFVGNLALFWLIGIQAKRVEKMQRESLQEQQQQLLELLQRENERMRNYAKMES